MKIYQYFNYPVYLIDINNKEIRKYLDKHFLSIKSKKKLKYIIKLIFKLLDYTKFILAKDKKYLERYFLHNNIVVIESKRFFRIIDFNERKVTNYLKDGFNKIHLQNEIKARQEYKNITPELYQYDDKKYIDEFLVDLIPVKSMFLTKKKSQLIFELLIDKYFKYQYEISNKKENYINSLLEKIFKLNDNENIKNYINNLVKKIDLKDINVCLSHGDFRVDQLFVTKDEKDIVIIDWECAIQTSVYFDFFFFYITREEFYNNLLLKKYFDKLNSTDDIYSYFNIFKIEVILVVLNYSFKFDFQNLMEELERYDDRFKV